MYLQSKFCRPLDFILTKLREVVTTQSRSRYHKLKENNGDDSDLYEHDLLLDMDYEDDEEDREIILNNKSTPIQRLAAKSNVIPTI